MKLKSLEYSEPGWYLNGLNFSEASLVVGKNAVGKSKTIKALSILINIIAQQKEIKESDYFYYNIIFTDNNDNEFTYRFTFYSGKVVKEILHDNNGNIFIRRDKKQTLYYGEEINPPANKLSLTTRRDTVLYPEIEKIIEWAESSYGLLFNQIDPVNDDISSFNIMSKCHNLITMFEKLDESAKQQVIKDLNNLDYKIDDLNVQEIGQKFKILHITESGVKDYLWEASISQGMQRTLFLIIFINYLSLNKENTKIIAIDDFCEGLDYDRSIKLGKYLYKFCIENNIQLITTSNDSFLMDVVDLKYWNILHRKGDKVTAINIYNSPELFEDFEFTGLSNFDLFSSDFIARHKK